MDTRNEWTLQDRGTSQASGNKMKEVNQEIAMQPRAKLSSVKKREGSIIKHDVGLCRVHPEGRGFKGSIYCIQVTDAWLICTDIRYALEQPAHTCRIHSARVWFVLPCSLRFSRYTLCQIYTLTLWCTGQNNSKHFLEIIPGFPLTELLGFQDQYRFKEHHSPLEQCAPSSWQEVRSRPSKCDNVKSASPGVFHHVAYTRDHPLY